MTKADIFMQIDTVSTQMNLGHHWVEPRECIEKPLECIEKLARAARLKGISEATETARQIDIQRLSGAIAALIDMKASNEKRAEVLRAMILMLLSDAIDAIIDEDVKIPALEAADDDAEIAEDEVLPDLESAD